MMVTDAVNIPASSCSTALPRLGQVQVRQSRTRHGKRARVLVATDIQPSRGPGEHHIRLSHVMNRLFETRLASFSCLATFRLAVLQDRYTIVVVAPPGPPSSLTGDVGRRRSLPEGAPAMSGLVCPLVFIDPLTLW